MFKKIRTYNKKMLAGFFASIMMFSAISPTLDVMAEELGKVNVADEYGEYYNQHIHTDKALNNYQNNVTQDILKKEPEAIQQETTYPEEWEVEERRTENSKTYKLPDGTYVEESYFEPIFKEDNDGKLEEIDNTLEETNTKVENKDGAYDFVIDEDTMTLTNEDGESLQLQNQEANMSVFSTKDNAILYSEAYQNMDMEYRLQGDKVVTNYHINGKTLQTRISFFIHHDGLKLEEREESMEFIREDGTSAFTYIKPTLQDENGNQLSVIFSYTIKDNNTVEIHMELNPEQVNSADRVYPLLLRAGAVDNSKVIIDINSCYTRELQPYITSQYFDLYVGYEDQFWSASTGTPTMGATRIYMHIGDLGLGENQLILEANLELYKKVSTAGQWNTIQVSKSNGYVDVSTLNWNNHPTGLTPVSTTQIRSDPGWVQFDVKSYIEDIYKKKNNIIELKATDESSSYFANVFYGESGAALPKLTVKYRDDFDVRPDLEIDTFDTEMRIFGISNQGFEALSFDGIARPDSQVIFELVEKEKDEVLGQITSKGNSNRYFIDPIYITDPIANTQTYAQSDVNYTTAYINKEDIPEYDVVYEYSVKVKQGNTTSTKAFKTDSLVKYRVKLGDTLPSIASYYGVKIEDIKADNNIGDTIKEGDTLLVRFKKNNPKVSKDVYTPPIKVNEYVARYVNRGPRCVGTCDIIEPAGSNNGNYFFEGTDFTLTDFEEIPFMRYYNSTDPQVSGMFGNGFTSTLESFVSYDKDGNLLYFKGDGKIFQMKKTAIGFEADWRYKLDVKVENNTIVITDLGTQTTYQFNTFGYLETITYESGYQSTITYDEYGLFSKMQLGTKEVSFEYNENNLIKEIVLPSGDQVNYTYEGRNLVSFKDAVGNVETYYYNKNNFLTYREDKNGNKTAINTYDDEGRVTKQIDANGNETILNFAKGKTTVLNPDGSEDVYEYNEYYQAESVTISGDINTYVYDERGNIISETNADGEKTKHSYDGFNLTKSEYPDGTTEEYRYDLSGNIIYHKDRQGNVEEFTYQGLDMLTKTSNGVTTSFTYDSAHRVLSETDGLGATKNYTYVNNQIASVTHSSGLVEYFTYNANGNVIKENDNQGKVTTYVYNANGQMIQKNYYDGTNEKWTYTGEGEISSYQDRLGAVTTNTYDNNNNLIASTKGGYTLTNTYNSLNQLIEEKDMQGLVTKYKYDSQGNQIEVIDAFGNATKTEYNVDGNVVKTIDHFGNEEVNTYEGSNVVKTVSKEGLTTEFTYDSFNRLMETKHPNGTIETVTYDNNQNISKTVDMYGNETYFTYNAYHQVIETKIVYVTGEMSITKQSYDSYGNLVKEDIDGAITTHTFDVYGQEIATTDALGNTTKQDYNFDGLVTKEMDALGNIKEIKYNGNGDVIEEKDNNGNVSKKQYDTNGFLVAETDALGFVTSYEYNDKGQNIAVINPYKVKTEIAYNDYNQVISKTTNGTVLEEKEYDEYGREIGTYTPQEKKTTVYDNFDRVESVTNELTGLTTIYMFDDFGNTIKEEDSEGLATSTEYNNYQQPIKITDVYGRIKTIMYDERGREIEVKEFDGLTTKTTYDMYDNVLTSTSSLGVVTTNTYNAIHQVATTETGGVVVEYVYDGNGQVLEEKDITSNTSKKTSYDANGNVLSETNVLGNTTSKKYDAKNQVISEIDANGNETNHVFDAMGKEIETIDPYGNSIQTKYNELGLKVLEVDPRGFSTEYTYNEHLLVAETIDKLGNSSYTRYNDALQVAEEENQNGAVKEYTYDIYGRTIKEIEPNGKETTRVYDALGNIIEEVSSDVTTKTTYDDKGNLLTTIKHDVVMESNTYNEYNQVVKTIDGNNNKSTFIYDSLGNMILSNEKGYVKESSYDVYGNLVKQVDNKTYVQEFRYDANKQMLETKVNGKVKVRKEYDANGNEIKVVENNLEKQMSYDKLNRMIELNIPSASSTDFVTLQTLTYDEVGNVLEITDHDGNKEKRKYDANNNAIQEWNKKGIENKYEYDSLGNMTKMQNADERYVSYTYDVMNNVTYKQLNKDKTASYTYDLDNRLLSETSEYGYTNEYRYDAFGNQISHTTPDGTTVQMNYDALGNKISEGNNSFVYDQRNNVIETKNESGTVTYKYNAFNQMTQSKDTNDEKVTYTYNNDNLLVNKAYGGIDIDQDYNENGQLSTVYKNDTVVATYAYNHRGEMVQSTQNGVETKKSYDDTGRMVSQVSSSKGKTIYSASYVYDSNDNITKEVINGKANTYAYDDYDELIESNKYIDGQQVKTTYEYDLFGNQVVDNGQDGKKTYHYNDNNQISSIDTKDGTITLDYDKNGNITEKKEANGSKTTYQYNEFNLLTQVDQGQYTYTYAYDAQQNRISETRKDNKDYHYDVWYDYSITIDVVSEEEIGDGFDRLRDQVTTKEANGGTCQSLLSDSYDVTYYKEDEVTNFTLDRNMEYVSVLAENEETNVYGLDLIEEGNATTIAGTNGSIVAKVEPSAIETISYQDYGKSTVDSGHGFNGEMKDETGLVYLRARYYDPDIARFIQIDRNYEGTKDNIISQNRYTFTLNNPYKYVDRDGNVAGIGGLVGIAGDVIQVETKVRYWLHLDKKEFEKKIKGFTTLQKLVAWNIYNNRTIMQIAVSFMNSIVTTVTQQTTQNTFENGQDKNKTDGDNKGDNKKPKPKDVKVKCPEKSGVDKFLDKIQEILDWVGWIPFAIGDIADGLNALIHFIRGNVLMGIINVVCLALPAAVMAGAKAIGKTCKNAVEFVSKLSPTARAMVTTVKGFITGMRDAIGKVIWLVGEKTIRPIMNKLDDFAKWVGDIFSKATSETTEDTAKNVTKNTASETAGNTIQQTTKKYTKKFLQWLNEGAMDTTVYFAKDESGNVLYVGISKQDLQKRLAQHLANGKEFENGIKPAIEGLTENLTKNQARAIEQYYIEKYGLSNLDNKINSIAKNSEYYDEAKEWALEFLGGR